MGGTAYSIGSHHFSHIRSAGSRGRTGSPGEGKVFGGVYHPRYRRPDGRIVPARWEGSFYKNSMYYTDQQSGQRVEGRKDIIRVCAWNSQTAQPGRGLADLFAKAISPGKELSGEFEMRTYDRKVYLSNGQQVTEVDGTPLMIPGMIKFYVERGKFVLGADSAKFVQAEIQDGIRPADWNNAASPTYQQWQQANAERMAQVWQGLPVYGYAQVIVVPNVQYEYPLRNEPIPNLRIFGPGNYGNQGNQQGGFGGNSGNGFGGGNQNQNGGFNPAGGGGGNNGFQNNFASGGGNAGGNGWDRGGNQNQNQNGFGGGNGGFGGGNQNTGTFQNGGGNFNNAGAGNQQGGGFNW